MIADPILFFAPNTLMDAIYLQAFQEATSSAELLQCGRPGCPEYWAVGPGTGRRKPDHKSKVHFCSPKCQKAHAYMKKPKGASQ